MKTDCPNCAGDGFVFEDCQWCNGNPQGCRECGWNGDCKIECMECRGTGRAQPEADESEGGETTSAPDSRDDTSPTTASPVEQIDRMPRSFSPYPRGHLLGVAPVAPSAVGSHAPAAELLLFRDEMADQLSRMPHHRQAQVLAFPQGLDARQLAADTVLAMEQKGVRV